MTCHLWLLTISVAVIASMATVAAARNRTLTMEGLENIRIGMDLSAAEKALGAKLIHDYEATGSEECWWTEPADGSDPEVGYMVEYGRITRIDVTGTQGDSPVKSDKGIGVGASESELKSAYGADAIVQVHPYVGTWHHFVVDAPDRRSGMIFETDGSRVTSLRAGSYPSVGYIEGCE